ncbi:hypothetical protein Tco_0252398 [Tanacetum coccineum]
MVLDRLLLPLKCLDSLFIANSLLTYTMTFGCLQHGHFPLPSVKGDVTIFVAFIAFGAHGPFMCMLPCRCLPLDCVVVDLTYFGKCFQTSSCYQLAFSVSSLIPSSSRIPTILGHVANLLAILALYGSVAVNSVMPALADGDRGLEGTGSSVGTVEGSAGARCSSSSFSTSSSLSSSDDFDINCLIVGSIRSEDLLRYSLSSSGLGQQCDMVIGL